MQDVWKPRFAGVLLVLCVCVACSSEPVGTVEPATQVVASPVETVVSTSVVPEPTSTPAATALPASVTPSVSRLLLLQDPFLEGEDVLALQQRLLDLGYRQLGSADGVFGPATERALVIFQQVNDLDADGVLGPQTSAVLFSDQALEYAELAAIVDAQTGFLLGASKDSLWLTPDQAAVQLTNVAQYRVFSLDGVGEQLGAGPVRAEQAGPCEGSFLVDLHPSFVRQAIALSGLHDPLIRPVRGAEISAEMQQAVVDWLAGEGMPEPQAQITQALEVDLDGDGANEFVLSATRYADTVMGRSAEPGDYSLVLVWSPSQAESQGVVAELYPQAKENIAANTHRILAVLDLNDDQVMEVVVESMYYEGRFVDVYALSEQGFVRVLGAGCGV